MSEIFKCDVKCFSSFVTIILSITHTAFGYSQSRRYYNLKCYFFSICIAKTHISRQKKMYLETTGWPTKSYLANRLIQFDHFTNFICNYNLRFLFFWLWCKIFGKIAYMQPKIRYSRATQNCVVVACLNHKIINQYL